MDHESVQEACAGVAERVVERMVERAEYQFNTDWYFKEDDAEEYSQALRSSERWQQVCLPHSNALVPRQDMDSGAYQFRSWYKKEFRLPPHCSDKRVWLSFEGAMSVAQVYINGQRAGEHQGGYTPFTMDITDFLDWQSVNTVAVRLDSRAQSDIPPEGGRIDYLLFGGLYREARLTVLGLIHIIDAFIWTESAAVNHAVLRGSLRMANRGRQSRTVRVRAICRPKNGVGVLSLDLGETTVSAGSETGYPVTLEIMNPRLWDVDHPELYEIEFWLLDDEESVDKKAVTFGIRTIQVDKAGVLLNGRLLKLRGLNRHQTFPVIGGAAPARLQRRDAWILKRQLGLNFVRTSHYPQDPHFLAACDELGLLVFEELPGWNYIGGDRWKATGLQLIREMILRDRNHASIFLWGVRINESADDHDFYFQTNQLARSLDPTRPTGGGRDILTSEWLEDVYTFNDFSLELRPTVHTPTLITEYLGHMFPVKPTDPEPLLVMHALHHAGIVNQLHGRADLMGGSGWCAFDYNTRHTFGSGNGVCHHGVCDLYRNLKFAGFFYASQMDADQGIVLYVATYLTDASLARAYFPADHPFYFNLKNESLTVYVFTNCDSVSLEKDGVSLGVKIPDRERFPFLPHPPVSFAVPVAPITGRLRAVGYVRGEPVRMVEVRTPESMHRLVVQADDSVLAADGSDMTCIRATLVDRNGQRLPYANHVVTFATAGPLFVMGTDRVSLDAGIACVYAKTGTTPGSATIAVSMEGVPTERLTIEIRADSRLQLPSL